MKKYPKVPRYDHPVVTDEWFGNNTTAVEKFDGSHFRFAVYDPRYEEYYNDFDFDSKTLLIGTKNQMGLAEDADLMDKTGDLELEERVQYLTDRLDIDTILEIHRQRESPLLFHCENMVQHTIEDYRWSEIPKLIGFDIYDLGEISTGEIASNPYKQKFTGYLDWKTTDEIFNRIGLETPKVVKRDIQRSDLNEDVIPMSEYGDVRAEGIVVRHDVNKRRLKYRRKDFIEKHRKVTGSYNPDKASKEKIIAYRNATNQRIIEILKNEKTESTPEFLDELVYDITEDMWVEEYDPISSKWRSFDMSEVQSHIADRVVSSTVSSGVFSVSVGSELREAIERWDGELDGSRFKSVDNENHKWLVDKSLTQEVFLNNLNKVLQRSDREIGRWVIGPLGNEIYDWIMVERRENILHLKGETDFKKLKDSIYDKVVQMIDEQI